MAATRVQSIGLRRHVGNPASMLQVLYTPKAVSDAHQAWKAADVAGSEGCDEKIAEARETLRQVKLLVSGAGVHYAHWPEDFYFRRGEPVTLAMDIGEIQDAANEIDRRPGYRDRGNGWLLNHPLQKLMNYQFYLHHMAADADE